MYSNETIGYWVKQLAYAAGVLSVTFWLTTCNTGCAGWKAVNSTRAVEAISAAEHGGGPIAVPGDLLGNPALANRLILINPTPGRDTTWTFNYPDGTPAATGSSKRSTVTDALLASIAGIDAGKFAEDARREAVIMGLLDRLLAYVPTPAVTSAALQARLERATNPPPPDAGGQSWKDEMRAIATQAAQAAADALAAKLGATTKPPATAPSP